MAKKPITKKKALKAFKDAQKPLEEDAPTKLFRQSKEYVESLASREQMLTFIELFNSVQEDKIEVEK
ncbi:hypothetical protein EQG49_01545 [Periweissella cryptocerci]|uniref:Uncharacterized protein n=1 Tax=Periweissella cryptocerci TaxID=2506420 RepID=A0A4P6YRH9_9LACO|nr:hypothetical protein [Periweissella cryptocerci]QBO35234.1 hypothetical protein EQG49_01545 [Periweissella cryptocerci]